MATKLVIQFILIKCEFAQPDGHIVLDPSTSTVQSLLLQVPTDSVEDTFPPFRMDTASIREWVEFSEQKSKIPTKNELILADLEQEAIQIGEHPASLPIQELSKSLTSSESATQELTETVANTISSMETNPFESIPKEE